MIIELQPTCLETLSLGEHKLAAKFDDGADATATFIVKAKSATASKTGTAPKTGDESTPILWLAVMLISALLLVSVTYNKRKQSTMK